VLSDSTFNRDQFGAFLSRATNVQVYRCQFVDSAVDGLANHRFGIMMAAGSSGRIEDNTVDGAIPGVLVRASSATVSSNTIADVTMHAVSLQAAIGVTAVERDDRQGDPRDDRQAGGS
jgi:Right handed beta helix region